jgi:hypothetical protein
MRRELLTDVDMVKGHFGEFKILVDGDVVIEAGPLAGLGVLPSGGKIVEAVRSRLSA